MKKIAFLVEDKNSTQYRYRILNISDALKKSEKFSSEIFLLSDSKKFKSQFKDFSFLVILRQTPKGSTLLNLIESAKKNRLKVIFDLDDLIFDYRYLRTLMSSTNSKNIFYWLGYFFGIRRIAKRVDGFLTTNDFLAKKLKTTFNKPVAVIPNSLNSAQISASKDILKNKPKSKNFTLGYFSGSPTHAKDFRLIEPELIKFLNDFPDSILKIVGYMNFSNSAQKLLKEGRIVFEKPVDYLKLQEKIASVNVNLAPLLINDFTNCKSELKFFEAAIVETTTIASPNFSFKTAIKNNETGFLTKPDEWYKTLKFLYENPKENQKIARAAKNYCLENYYGENLLKIIERAYDELSI